VRVEKAPAHIIFNEVEAFELNGSNFNLQQIGNGSGTLTLKVIESDSVIGILFLGVIEN
jgi:hypothetical protein